MLLDIVYTWELNVLLKLPGNEITDGFYFISSKILAQFTNFAHVV